jgi:hypothetical protein
MIAIPRAAFMRSVAMSVGSAPQARCNERGHETPMIAIPRADDCGSLHVVTAVDALDAHEHGTALPIRGIAPSDLEKPRRFGAFLTGFSTTNRPCRPPAEQHQWLARTAARQVRKMGLIRPAKRGGRGPTHGGRARGAQRHLLRALDRVPEGAAQGPAAAEHGVGLPGPLGVGRLCWAVERSFAWLSRYRRLNTIFERSKEYLIAFVAIAFISILARRLKRLVVEECSA